MHQNNSRALQLLYIVFIYQALKNLTRLRHTLSRRRFTSANFFGPFGLMGFPTRPINARRSKKPSRRFHGTSRFWTCCANQSALQLSRKQAVRMLYPVRRYIKRKASPRFTQRSRLFNTSWPALTYYFFMLRYYHQKPVNFVAYTLRFFRTRRSAFVLDLFKSLHLYGTRYLVYLKRVKQWAFVPPRYYRKQVVLGRRKSTFYTLENRTLYLRRQRRKFFNSNRRKFRRLSRYHLRKSGLFSKEPMYKTVSRSQSNLMFPLAQHLVRRQKTHRLLTDYVEKLQNYFGRQLRSDFSYKRLFLHIKNNFSLFRTGLSRSQVCLFFKKTRSNMYFTVTNGLGEVRFSMSAGRVVKSAKRSKKARASFYPLALLAEYVARRLRKLPGAPLLDVFYVPSHYKFKARKTLTLLYKNGIVPRRVVYTTRTPHSRFGKTKKTRRL